MHSFTVVLLAATLALAPCALAQQRKTRKAPGKVPAAAPQVQQPAVNTPPPPPPTPEQGPSSPPDVSFQGGQLTILAKNSTMGDVLKAVKQKTGATVEMPAVASERVVGQFGPGAPRDVMAQLLNGSHYDYVLLGSPTDPGALKTIVLTARASGPEPAPVQQPPQGFQQNQQLQAVPEVETDQAQEEPGAELPPEIQQQQEEEQPQEQQNPQGQPVVKTPEQLLRELQQQQQQQQQQSGQQAQPPQ
ncbi:MAG TPA: hypothetical protein VFB00_09535 [Terriglobales bacterium]|nr:hypothetical protein [Terriglobales bacterium]